MMPATPCPLFTSRRSLSCTFPHCTATAIANSSRNKCTRMKLATKKSCRLVERANWIPTEFQTGTHEYHHYYYYFMCIRNGVEVTYSLSVIGLTIYLNWKRELTSHFFTDLSHFRWRNSREAAALPDWRDAKYVYHDEEVCREFGQSSCLSYARGHLSTAHW